MGAALALDAAGRRDLRDRRRLGLRRLPQAGVADLRDDAGADRAAGRGLPLRRRRRGQLRRRPQGWACNAVHFRDNEQAIGEIRAALDDGPPRLVVGAGAVPDVELDRLDRELHLARRREQAEDQLERILLGDAGVDRLLAAEAGGELQRLAPVLAERAEGAHQEVPVRDRLADLERAVPGGEHREVVLVELGERLGVVGLELAVGDLVHPGADRLAEELAASLAADRVGDRADRVGWVYEAERHRGPI